jgi:hypothetical protein
MFLSIAQRVAKRTTISAFEVPCGQGVAELWQKAGITTKHSMLMNLGIIFCYTENEG